MAIQDFYHCYVYESGDIVCSTETRNSDPDHVAEMQCWAARLIDALSTPCPEPEPLQIDAKSGSK